MRVYAGTLSCTVCREKFMRQGGFWLAVAVHSTLTINLGRAVGKLKCDDGDEEEGVNSGMRRK